MFALGDSCESSRAETFRAACRVVGGMPDCSIKDFGDDIVMLSREISWRSEKGLWAGVGISSESEDGGGERLEDLEAGVACRTMSSLAISMSCCVSIVLLSVTLMARYCLRDTLGA